MPPPPPLWAVAVLPCCAHWGKPREEEVGGCGHDHTRENGIRECCISCQQPCSPLLHARAPPNHAASASRASRAAYAACSSRMSVLIKLPLMLPPAPSPPPSPSPLPSPPPLPSPLPPILLPMLPPSRLPGAPVSVSPLLLLTPHSSSLSSPAPSAAPSHARCLSLLHLPAPTSPCCSTAPAASLPALPAALASPRRGPKKE
ncbi:unnamed protein product [Closterium sp. NIES-65]|nr:unnamed protein product [Closterium sp. NIES-65]